MPAPISACYAAVLAILVVALNWSPAANQGNVVDGTSRVWPARWADTGLVRNRGTRRNQFTALRIATRPKITT
jgi:hypothetical protein